MIEFQYTVGDADVDPIYRHVDHARSLKLLERARMELLDVLGFPNDAFIAQGLFPVVTAIRAEYKREVMLGPITVTCDSWRLNERRFTMRQRILNGRGKEAVNAEVDWMFMDGPTKRGVPPPKDFIAALSARQKPS